MKTMPILVCLLCAGALIYGIRDMPRVGDPNSPANSHPGVAQRYIASADQPDGTLGEIGPANMVTSVLGDYRGYDTFGETTVIFTAALCVLLLLRHGAGTGGSPIPAGQGGEGFGWPHLEVLRNKKFQGTPEDDETSNNDDEEMGDQT